MQTILMKVILLQDLYFLKKAAKDFAIKSKKLDFKMFFDSFFVNRGEC